jgi:tight adherence protein B
MSAEGVVLELAGLLKSGLPPTHARAEVEQRLGELSQRQLDQLGAVWQLALSAGASMSWAIESLGETFRAAARHRREIDLAFAGPKATAKLVAWLPAAGLVLAQLFGLNPLGAILTIPLALIALLVGALLLIVGHRWSKSIITRAAPSEDDPGLYFDALRFGMESGLPLAHAIDMANSAFDEQLNFVADSMAIEKLERIAELNRASGASIGKLLAGEAAARREALWFRESTDLARLSVKLMIPLGVVTLPAFVLSTIVPVAISLLSSRRNY